MTGPETTFHSLAIKIFKLIYLIYRFNVEYFGLFSDDELLKITTEQMYIFAH